MKKLITLFCIACMSVSAIAQSGVRIGNYVFHVQKAGSDIDTNVYVEDTPCPPCPSENETRSKPKFYPHKTDNFFVGVSTVYPERNSDYYTVMSSNSINIDAGEIEIYHISRWFAMGRTMQYSYYNYKLKPNEPIFMEEVIGRPVAKDDIRKQTYQSHNIAVSLFPRFYLTPSRTNYSNKGIYLDLGVQGDYAFNKYCKLNTHSEGKKKYRDNYAFNPFSASAIARVGFGNSWAVLARYRFTDTFNNDVLPMDLPPISIGIQIF